MAAATVDVSDAIGLALDEVAVLERVLSPAVVAPLRSHLLRARRALTAAPTPVVDL